MYFPYLRGKMYELLAVKELITRDLIQEKYISPIIEPVKENSTFVNLLNSANSKNYKLNVISNPKVGEFDNLDKLAEMIVKYKMTDSVIISDKDNYAFKRNSLLFYESAVKVVNDETKMSTINVIPYSLGFDQKIGNPDNKVVFFDCFKKQNRNSDYLNIPDEDFSEYHLLYKDAGYIGFGDYSVIGKDYSDSGFAPYAVAIHVVYFDKDNALRIKHFVSDSNDDIYDPANKLHEALKKLIDWYRSTEFNAEKNDSVALNELERIYQEDRYTGLGYLKKLEIMHHLEIMNRYLRSTKGE